MIFYNGSKLRIGIYGESHSKDIGVEIKGVPEAAVCDIDTMQKFLDRRAPGKNAWSTPRKEPDSVIVDKISGGEFKAHIENTNIRPHDYSELLNSPRPSHADYTARLKYGDSYLSSGGGAFSGRMTAPLCIAGSLAMQNLEKLGIRIYAHVKRIAGVSDNGSLSEISSVAAKEFPVIDDACGELMISKIADARADGDSVGGVIECVIEGCPGGLGGPLFEGVEGKIASICFAVPAVKGVEFGNGFEACELRASENNDSLSFDDEGNLMLKTNRCGGILGGITAGDVAPIVFDVGIKPTPTISKEQDTVDLTLRKNVKLKAEGRHDPCIVPRAVPVIEACAAIALWDLILDSEGAEDDGSLAALRARMDAADSKLMEAFVERMETAERIGECKKGTGKAVLDKSREEAKLKAVSELADKRSLPYVRGLYEYLFEVSRDLQSKNSKPCFGVLGEKLPHTYSPLLHSLYTDAYSYEKIEMSADEVRNLFASGGGKFCGFNVTVPHKKLAYELCDEVSERARNVGAVNTVVFKDGKAIGDNTDVYGFIYLLSSNGINVQDKKCLILGTGGASAAVFAALKELGASEILFCSRNGEINYDHVFDIDSPARNAAVLINTTPVGMYPKVSESPIDLRGFTALEACVDVIYNPSRTKLLQQAEKLGVKAAGGLSMLSAQAYEASKIFSEAIGSDFTKTKDDIAGVNSKLSSLMLNTVLIGMPGSGKTTYGKRLAAETSREFVDLDEAFALKFGRTPAEVIKADGEDAFRKMESEVASDYLFRSGLVIATGGGIVTRSENIFAIKANSEVLFLDAPLSYLKNQDVSSRPLSAAGDDAISKLYETRRPLYLACCDKILTMEEYFV